MIIDIPGQFRRLFPSYERCLDLSPQQMLDIVESRLDGARHRAATAHWAYEGIVAVRGLQELRDALKPQIASERRAA